MDPIKINVEISLSDTTLALLQTIFAKDMPANLATPPAKPEVKPAVPAVPAASTKPTTPTTPAKPAVPVKPAAPASTTEAKPAAPAISDSEVVTLDKLRAIAMTKMNTHRSEIRQKLDEFESASLTKLDKSNYDAMYDFLKNLE